MMRTIGWITFSLAVVFGLGLYLGWFTLNTSGTTDDNKPGIQVGVNKDKIKEDANDAKEKVKGFLGDKKIEGTIHQLQTVKEELTVRDSDKHDVAMGINATTRIKIGVKDAAFSDLKADDIVTVTYESNKEGNVARTITVAK